MRDNGPGVAQEDHWINTDHSGNLIHFNQIAAVSEAPEAKAKLTRINQIELTSNDGSLHVAVLIPMKSFTDFMIFSLGVVMNNFWVGREQRKWRNQIQLWVD